MGILRGEGCDVSSRGVCRHFLLIVVPLVLILGIPYMMSDSFRAFTRGEDIDAVSSSTVILDAPSGEFVALINKNKRSDEETLDIWMDFFSGEEISYLFEDIVCAVGRGDSSAIEMAQSLQSRLPENQMKIDIEDVTLMLSKAEYGRFDIILLSKEMADAYGASDLYDHDDVARVRTGQNDSAQTEEMT